MRTRRGIGVQQERRAKGHTAVSGTDVIDVARVTASTVLGIDQVNNAVVGSRLTPALMPPVAAVSAKHPGEVTRRTHARSREGRAGIGVSPACAAISGLEDEVRVVVGKATTAFVHAGDVQVPVARHVTGDLHVADEGILSAHHHRAAPSITVISGANNEDVRVADIKVVPGNIHVSEVRRARVIISPARLAVGRALVENAEMRPAIWILRSGGLIPAKTLTTARTIQPHREPSAGRLVVQKNRVAKGVVEGALTIGLGKAGKGSAAVRGERCARDVDRVKVAAA